MRLVDKIGNLAATTLMLLLTVMLAGSIVLAISIGSVDIPVDKVFNVLAYQLFGIAFEDPALISPGTVDYDIIWSIRSPRVFMAVIIGMILALAGVVMQATVQNPLADPYILGISSGASLGATFAIMVGASTIFTGALANTGIIFWAFLGAFVASMAVLLLSSIGGKMTSVKLVLSGAIIASLMGAFSNLIIVLAPDPQRMQSLTFWLLGSLSGATWSKLLMPLLALAICLIYFMTQLRSLNTMLVGDDTATTLGVNLAKKRTIYIFLTSVLTASAVSMCGVVGFVGLMIPHVVRGLVGNNHWKVVPLSCMVGATFLVFADLLARVALKNVELPLGIITAVCGAPIFAYIMIKKAYSFGA